MSNYKPSPEERDSGKFEDATYEQLEIVFRNVRFLSGVMLNAYLEWADGKRAWTKGTAYAIGEWKLCAR